MAPEYLAQGPVSLAHMRSQTALTVSVTAVLVNRRGDDRGSSGGASLAIEVLKTFAREFARLRSAGGLSGWHTAACRSAFTWS